MIIVLKKGATQQDIDKLTSVIAAFLKERKEQIA